MLRGRLALLPALALVAMLLVTGCAGSDASGGVARPTPTPRPFAPSFRYQACNFALPEGHSDGESISCGTLTVLEDRASASGRTIDIAVAILRATGQSESPDPVIYLHGGPGAAALSNDIQYFTRAFAEPLQVSRDIIFFDQRGVGRSEPALTCSEFDWTYYSLQKGDDPYGDALAQCRYRLTAASDLNAYSSATNAADILDLAEALGYEQYNLYGVSYGTRLALTAMRDAPQRIRSVVLDSTVPTQANLYVDGAVNLERSLNALFDACAAHPECRGFAPDLRGTFFGLVAQLDADPAVVPVQDFGTAQVVYRPVDGSGLLQLMFHAFYDTSLIPSLPLGIMQVAQGDTRMLSVLASFSSRFDANWSLGMHLALQCREEAPFNPPEAIVPASNARITGETRDEVASLHEDCAVWGVAPAGPEENAPVQSDIPTLVLAGTFDPVTPPRYGRLAAETLSRATYVEFADFGHAVLSEGCPMDIVVRFLADPAQPPDTSCAGAMPPMVFVTP